MPEKSFVTMEQAVCPVCAKIEDTGALLLDKRMRSRFDRTTVTGFAMCAEHQKLADDGYIALVVIDQTKSADMTPNGVWRTGPICYVRPHVAEQLFDERAKRQDGSYHPIIWIDQEIFDMLSKTAEEANVE